jgi:hypothetical protein
MYLPFTEVLACTGVVAILFTIAVDIYELKEGLNSYPLQLSTKNYCHVAAVVLT